MPDDSSAIPPIAAIDIGTNSIHLIIAKIESDKNFEILDSHKDLVRLGDAIDKDRLISDEAIEKTVSAILHMREIATTYQPTYRVVATHATRSARNYKELFQKIYDATGIYVSLIDGVEEARLVSLGMLSGLPLSEKTFLGIDIGGGSTEIIICNKNQIKYVTSLEIGTVTLNKKFLKNEKLKKADLECLSNEIDLRLAPIRSCKNISFDCAVICSSAAKTLAQLQSAELSDTDLEDPNGYHLTSSEIHSKLKQIKKLGKPKKIKDVWDLDSHRAELLLAGTAILSKLSDFFTINEWIISTFGLREGLVLDTINRLQGTPLSGTEDIRWNNIQKLGQKYRVDENFATKVLKLALSLFDQLQPLAPIYIKKETGVQISDRGILKAAAWLHECGKFISFPKFHKNSYFLIAHSRLMGFSQKERQFIGLVARFHRKGKASRKSYYCSELYGNDIKRINYLASILRIASGANRSRQGNLENIKLEYVDNELKFMIKKLGNANPSVDLYKIDKEKSFLEEIIKIPIKIIS